MSILRKIFAVVIAMIFTGIVVGAVQKLGQNIYPLPVGADPENPEDINTLFPRFLNERFNEIIWVSSVANRIRATEQHLEQNIRYGFTQ